MTLRVSAKSWALMAHAERYVPYYRQMLADLGICAADIHSVGNLTRLPFLTKTLIRANADALKSERATTLTRYNTGGSSGEPFIFFIGK
jgi:phenylacetate-CoA ligase